MPESLHLYELIEILPWNKGYCEKPIDSSNPLDVCNWCRELHKYHLPNDTGDVMYRFNIGVYQLTYVNSMLHKRDIREWGEAIASAYIHMVASFENCGVQCDTVELDCETSLGPEVLYKRILLRIPIMTKHVLYKAMGRKNRFDVGELQKPALDTVRDLVLLNHSTKPCLWFSECLRLAMDKLANREINTH